jgi:leucyl aminopeptidase
MQWEEITVTPYISEQSSTSAIAIEVVNLEAIDAWVAAQDAFVQNWLEARRFKAKEGAFTEIPSEDGHVACVLLIKGSSEWNIWSLASLPGALPEGSYNLNATLSPKEAVDVSAGWSLATYNFDRYKKSDKTYATLCLPEGADMDAIDRVVYAVSLVRDLINLPTSDMGPKALEGAASQIAGEFEARQINVIGEDLLTYHFPMVHAVGRASAQAPRLVDMTWGDAAHPKVTIVGKGVCFDTGGLDLKPSAAMLMMKKDMGGSAIALGLAYMIMHANLPIRLRLLIPAVENAVSGNAYRPGDVLTSRKGKTVEIGNTDAEGRLVLADALTAAAEEEPELLIDFATLTGAARVAVGAEISATFTDDNELFNLIARHAEAENDPVWRLPLWDDYRHLLDSKIADINNAGTGGFGGAITAGLFLKEFIEGAKSWIHFDVMAFNNRSRPGRPVGGEAFAMRAVFAALSEKYPR